MKEKWDRSRPYTIRSRKYRKLEELQKSVQSVKGKKKMMELLKIFGGFIGFMFVCVGSRGVSWVDGGLMILT